MQRAIMDQKGRVMLPKKVRKELGVRPGQSLAVTVKRGVIRMRKIQKPTPETNQLLWDISHPAHSKIKVTSKLLKKLKDEQWSGR